ncbi:hypothetical protein OBBRIDRAFT_137350 [Obba rivulosa]|uniref:Uncharacterized protein n=1 Tax=Obba rivulosa TaxID=1052685 RepID=A0A8E2ASU2_9APHY|nr:hypothetical protein OBBRIDRAFT_137350 [Obba rivulosa]
MKWNPFKTSSLRRSQSAQFSSGSDSATIVGTKPGRLIDAIQQLSAASKDVPLPQSALRPLLPLLACVLEIMQDDDIDHRTKSSLEHSVDVLTNLLSSEKSKQKSGGKQSRADAQEEDGTHNDRSQQSVIGETSRWETVCSRILGGVQDILNTAQSANVPIPGFGVALSLLSLLVTKVQDTGNNQNMSESLIKRIEEFRELLQSACREIELTVEGSQVPDTIRMLRAQDTLPVADDVTATVQ